jgi:hypothetical protein
LQLLSGANNWQIKIGKFLIEMYLSVIKLYLIKL